MKIFLAKPNKTLQEHSQEVLEKVLEFRKVILRKDYKTDYLSEENLKYAALFHDIGKLTNNFQKYFDSSIEKTKSIPYHHHEVGYAFLTAYTKLPKSVCKLVYWHHSINTKDFGTPIADILKCIGSADLKAMVKYVNSIDPNLLKQIPTLSGKTPSYYTNDEFDQDPEFIVGLGILLGGDRSASGANINPKTFNKKPNGLQNFYRCFENERFDNQINIVNRINGLTIVNAPTGFGKTMIGALLSSKTDKRLVWVCPRNVVTNELYHNIQKELRQLRLNYSVGMITGNQIQDSTDDSLDLFEHDITIVNIDSFLSPNFNNNNTFSFLNILNADVIFDEYHELVSDLPIFSLFIKLLTARHSFIDNTTVLLSGTPIDITPLLPTALNPTFLPEINKHYPAVHNKPYHISIGGSIPSVPNNTIYFRNTANKTIKYGAETNTKNVFHAKFTDVDKEKKRVDVRENYGFGSDVNEMKKGYISTHIGQAALDISFQHMYEDIISPLATLQRIGRVNRWGDSKTPSTITILPPDKNSRLNLYSNELTDLWFDFIIENFKDKDLTLDQMYEWYNLFHIKYNFEIKCYLFHLLEQSKDQLLKLFPKNRYINKSELSDKVIGSNLLRFSEHNEIYIIVRDYKTLKYQHILTIPVYNNDFAGMFDENSKTITDMVETAKILTEDENINVDYSNIINKNKYAKKNGLPPIDHFRLASKKNVTPYIISNMLYDEDLGLYKNQT